jgi:hypothetical protein
VRARFLSLVAFFASLAAAPGARAQDPAPPPSAPPQPAPTPQPATTDGRDNGKEKDLPAKPPPPSPDVPVSSDTSAPSVPGATPSPARERGVDPARTVQEAPSAHEGRFEFGSYGRVYASSDLRGGTGRGTNVVAFGPRIVDEGSYAELELRREDKFTKVASTHEVKSRVVATLALFPPFFHFTGKALQNIGLRNLYAQGTYDRLTLWAGSRMYRGDDI